MTAPAARSTRTATRRTRRAGPASPRPAAKATRPTAQVMEDANREDIRLAVVLNGGVSLAVWISGVVLELHRLVQASRTPGERRPQDAYAGLLDLLDATARIDVVAGTSAGGLNGGFLSLGLVRGCDLETMRELWRDQGDLTALLRDPRERDAPSLLRGEYFFEHLTRSYEKVLGTAGDGVVPAKDDGAPAEPVELYLTGTLWHGRWTSFADDMGRRIDEVDYDATFQFSSDPELVGDGVAGDLERPEVARQLAVASRCTSSFPGAFEPHEVTVHKDRPRDGRWESDAGLVNFSDTQYVVDGGVLRNKPIRPAIDAVYRQPAGPQVRRVLAYVVPDPGERRPGQQSGTRPPRAHEVLLGVLTRLRSTDSVSDELAEIKRRNDDVRQRRRTRDRLARALLDAAPPRRGSGPDLVAAAFPAYLEVRKDSAARTIARHLLAGAAQAQWSRHELAAVLRELADSEPGMPFVPSGGLEAALQAPPHRWSWGQSTVNRLGDVTLDVLRRGVWLAPYDSPLRADVVAARRALHEVLRAVRADRRSLDAFWKRQGAALPERGSSVVADNRQLAALRERLAASMQGWEGDTDAAREARRSTLREQCLRFAAVLADAAPALRAIATQAAVAVDPSGEELDRFRGLTDALLSAGSSPEDVLHCMLRLEVLQVAFAGASPEPEQEVELVQVSSPEPELLTGIQEHHFGAFYRASWRVNDWMRGRLDGSTQLVQMLLAPERLRQRGWDAATAAEQLRKVAVGPESGPRHAELVASWEAARPALEAELLPLDGDDALPRTFPRSAAQIAQRLHADILERELDELAHAVEHEPDRLQASVQWAGTVRAALDGGDSDLGRCVPLSRLQQLAAGSAVVGTQRIRDEFDSGTDTFARTATHGAAAFTSMLTAVNSQKHVAAVLSALRGYALLVWVLVNHLTSRSWFGTHVVAVVVGVGGALLGLGLLVPGLPAGVALTGVILVLGAATASALARRNAAEGPPWARVLVALVVVLLGVVGYVLAQGLAAQDWQLGAALGHLGRTAAAGAAQVLVVAAVVGLGWWLAGAKAPDRTRR